MEDTTPIQPNPNGLELFPIRTETVLAKLPVHNLSKKGSSISIDICKKDADGTAKLVWQVSPSKKYGEPAQLAYKLDTIVIDRVIDEAGKPLPERLRLGSLREVARELGLGSNTERLKRVLHQNASAYIRAKVSYTGNDGTEHTLEAGFTRYDVVFAGSRFRDGSKADAVYIELNARYREVLNNAPMRPLDLNYKKELTPTAQRFYEILSFKMFAALKNGHPEAKLNYSEYCTCSAQARYTSRKPFFKQMSRIQKPHLDSGYISAFRYQAITGEDGQPDWLMLYTPGPKAKEEFRAFGRQSRTADVELQSPTTTIEPTARSTESRRPRQQRFRFALPPEVKSDHPAFAAMIERGIAKTTAQELFAEAKDPDALLDQLEWGDEQIQKGTRKDNPPGFFIHLIKNQVFPPASFETSRQKAKREEEEKNRREAQLRHAETEIAYEDYLRQALNDHIVQNHLESEVEAIAQTELQEGKKKFPMMSADVALKRAREKARGVIKERLLPSLLTFEEFAAKRTTTLEG